MFRLTHLFMLACASRTSQQLSESNIRDALNPLAGESLIE